ncbi:MAG: META domain-containing protein [Flavobacteriaceae bacterium]|jgi:heat shock protein HslJ|nr:META domain-containing protein [Flavobacteriaceae bacterium]
MKKRILLVTTLAAISLASCNVLKPTNKEGKPNPVKTEKITETELSNKLEGTWVLSFLDTTLSGGKDLKQMFPGKTPSLTFDTTKNFASGNNGCNNIFGPYFLKGSNGITLGDKWGSTMMACNGVDDYAFSNALSSVNKFDIQDNKLHLIMGDIIVMTFIKDQDIKLEGTNWELSYIQPLDRSMKDLKDRFPQRLPSVEFTKNSFSGNSGCNNMSGSVEGAGDHIKFDKIALTRMFCEGVEENLFISNMEKVAKYKIENNELVLSSNDNMVLLKFKQK